MEKSQEVKTNFKPYFIHFTKPIHKNFVQSSDGFEILAYLLFYHLLTKEKNGLQW